MNSISAMKELPLVSVCMAVCNGGETLQFALQSAISQTYKNIEILVCDDASTDESLDLIEKFGKKDNRIVILKNETRVGIMENYNNLVKNATGKYVVLFDQDDKRTSDFISSAVGVLEVNPKAVIAIPRVNVLFLNQIQHANDYSHYQFTQTLFSRIWYFLRRPNDFLVYGLILKSSLTKASGWSNRNSSFHRLTFGLLLEGNCLPTPEGEFSYLAKGAVGRPTRKEELIRNSSRELPGASKFRLFVEFPIAYTESLYQIQTLTRLQKNLIFVMIWFDFVYKSVAKILGKVLIRIFRGNLPSPILRFLTWLYHPIDEIKFLTNPKDLTSGYYRRNWPIC